MLGHEWLPLAGAIVGFVVGLTGVGGGALMAPILLIGFGIDIKTVVATDLLFATITKLVASGVHIRKKGVNWRITTLLWVGSIPATISVTLLYKYAHSHINLEWVKYLLGSLIFASGIILMKPLFIKNTSSLHNDARPDTTPFTFKTKLLAILSGSFLGTIVTLTSVGVGSLGIVLFRAIFKKALPPRHLIGVDIVHAIPVSLIGGFGLLLLGFTNLSMMGLLLIGSIPAALWGSVTTHKLPPHKIKIALGFMLLIAAVSILLK